MDHDDIDVCVTCESPRLIGAPDCAICNKPTDKCLACGASQHECRAVA